MFTFACRSINRFLVFGNCTRINHTRKYMKSSDGESVSNNFWKILFLKIVKSLSSWQHLEKYFAEPIFGRGRPLTKYLVNASPPSLLKPRQLAIRSFGMFTIRKSLLGQLRMARMRPSIFGLLFPAFQTGHRFGDQFERPGRVPRGLRCRRVLKYTMSITPHFQHHEKLIKKTVPS